ncbi:Caleosin related protein-domain-containing protein [Cokeromyces recurvatus]|uniref:Caleosin related protein-domain-containing protein n=1 Tax=Cokeromyces recurvatus TaxID=90255 RepID=UPI00221E4C7E|nr:Caleosin related protein-domain-containing protein [Cokeromyces recurvatus]KAI7906940.1 Caleosin related protein-domain-containing protein [Cokeromyces recurvatus]
MNAVDKSMVNKRKLSSLLSLNNDVQRSSIEKLISFWDIDNKGYVSPYDLIAGFMELGYNVVFSVFFGASIGVLLSTHVHTGWKIDPLSRTNLKGLIRYKKRTQNNRGAFDEEGIFNLEKFNTFIDKYAKYDPSGKTIRVTEFIKMTKEQEQLENNMNSWFKLILEIGMVYFFIGHYGYFTRENICSFYDGSIFYRLRNDYISTLKDKRQRVYLSEMDGLRGPYISKSYFGLDPREMEYKIQAMFNSWQSKVQIVQNLNLDKWSNPIKKTAHKMKEYTVSHVFKQPTSVINGVPEPTQIIHSPSESPDEDANLEENLNLTGVASKPASETSLTDDDFFSALLSPDQTSASTSLNGSSLFGEQYNGDTHMNREEPIIFNYDSNHSTDMPLDDSTTFERVPSHLSSKPDSSLDTTTASMSSFLRYDEVDYKNWLTETLTGVQYDHVEDTIENTPNLSIDQQQLKLDEEVKQEKIMDKAEDKTELIVTTPLPDEKIIFCFEDPLKEEQPPIIPSPKVIHHINKLSSDNKHI